MSKGGTKRRHLKRSILSISSAICAALPIASIYAQEVVDEIIEEVTVTGSYIKGSATDAASPVAVHTREDMTMSKPILMSDIVKNLGINSGSTTNANTDTENGSIVGKGNVNLRGLGVNSTLILVNGKRMTAAAARTGRGETFTDINEIPVIMLERTEILKDGGSALYGSDAVAGVVNFITRNTFEGFEISASHQVVDNSDQDESVIDAIWGYSNDDGNFHFVIGGEYVKRDTLRVNEKGIVTERNRNTDLASAKPGIILSAPNPAWVNLQLSDFANNDFKYTDPGCGNSGQDSFTGTIDDPNNSDCEVDIRDYQSYVNEAERANVMATFSFAVNDGLEFYGDVLYSESEVIRPSSSTMNHIGGQALQLPSGSSSFSALFGAQSVHALAGWIPNEQLPELGGTCPIPGFGDLNACPRDLLAAFVSPAYATPSFDNAPNNASHGGWGDITALDFIVGEYALDDSNTNESKTNKILLGVKGEFEWFGNKEAFYDVSYGYSSNESESYQLTIIKDNMELALNGLGGPDCTPNGISDMNLTLANPYYAPLSYFLSGVDPEYMFNNTPNISQALTSTNQGNAADGCHFFNPYLSRHTDEEVANSEELINWMLEPKDKVNGSKTELETFDVVISSDIGEMGDTVIQGAFGYQYREYSRDQTEPALRRSTTSVLPSTGETIAVTNDAFYGTATTAYDESQKVQAVFGELKFNIGDTIDVQLAARYEDYDGIDSSLDPKIAVRWEASNTLALRASWGTAFRAPNIGLLYAGSGYDAAGVIDPLKLLAVRNGTCAPTLDQAGVTSCLSQLATMDGWVEDDKVDADAIAIFLKRGLPSPDLKPEESENYNIGAIWTPEGSLDGLTVSIDYFNVEYTKAIGPTPYSTSFENEVSLFNSLVGNPDNYIIKGTTTACTPEAGNYKSGCVVNPALYQIGNIDRIGTEAALGIVRATDVNLGTIETDGIEFAVKYDWETDYGMFNISHDIYWVNEYIIDDGITKEDIAGTNAAGSTFARSLPDLKANLAVTWVNDRHVVSAVARYIHDYYDSLYQVDIPSYNTVDLRYDFTYLRNGDKPLTFSIGANDIFDEDLPGRDSYRGYDTTVFDPRGRIFYTKVSMGF